MNEQPLIAIVLLNYNGKNLLERNLPFIAATTYSNKKIAVIDNGSADESVSFLESWYPGIQLIKLGTNKGYSAGYNEGLQHIDADYYILLNTDVEVSAGFIEPMLHAMTKYPGSSICQPKIRSLENRHMFEYAGAGGGFIDKYGYTFARGRILDQAEEDKGQYDQDCEVFWTSGACMMIRASLFKTLGGFYEYYFMYAEEVDLCWRAQLSGQKIYYCYASVVYHKETIEFARQSPQRIYHVFRNNLVMLFKNLPPQDKLRIIPARFILNIVAAFHFLIKGYFKKSFLVLRSVIAAAKWALTGSNRGPQEKARFRTFNTVYKRSILMDYYFRDKKRFSQLDREAFSAKD